ncbi:hypothetical protein ACIRU3_35240 [Streptomyces sp. NPDC101151]|uniref:hypothetical protein n=1 Tax=Streptomyces sp. NPDC101151 TaxID=3366115 RepID=UPI00382D0E9C
MGTDRTPEAVVVGRTVVRADFVMFRGESVAAPRMLLLNEMKFEPGGWFELERPLFLKAGDLLVRDGDQVIVRRATGQEERPAGSFSPWCRRTRLR